MQAQVVGAVGTSLSQQTEAERAQRQLWEDYPPQLGGVMNDAWRAVAQHPIWHSLRASFAPDKWPCLAVVGMESPEATETKWYADGSSLITVSDGLIRFLQNACDALFASSTSIAEGGKVTENSTLDPAASDQALGSTYLEWSALHEGTMPPPVPFALAPKAAQMARVHLRLALIFIALHEFGHAVLHAGKPHDAQLELEADAWAAEMLLQLDGRPANEQNLVLSGVVVTMRLFGALALLGLWHLGDYPPPTTRFQKLLEVFRARLPDEISFYVASTYAYTMDMRLEKAESVLRGMPVRPERPDQMISHVVSLLVEIYLNRMTLSQAAEIANSVFAEAPVKLRDVIARASDTFDPKQPSCADKGEWGALVRFVIEQRSALEALLAR